MNSGAQAPSKKVIVVGATGYIGKFVVQECTRRGFDTYAVLRPRPEYVFLIYFSLKYTCVRK